MSNLPFRHILVIEDEKSRRIVSLEETIYSIGRDATNAIVIYDRQVSRFHATILREEDTLNQQTSYKVIDGDLRGNISTNGVVVNGKPSLSHTLKHGDVVRFGEKAKALYYILSDPSVISLFKNNEEVNEQLESETNTEQQKSITHQENYKTTLTSEKDLEEMSQKELIRLASFPELSPNPIVEINWFGEITYLNPAASLKFKDISQLRSQHPILAGLTSNCQSKHGSLFVREVKIGGEIFEQYVHYLSENKLIRSYVFDFTKRKQVEAALRESEQLYRAVVRQSFEGIFLVDGKTQKILEVNQSYCNLVGYSLEETLGMCLEDLVIFDPEVSQENLKAFLLEQQDRVIDSLHRSKDNSLLKVGLSATVIVYKGREIFCFAVHRGNQEAHPTQPGKDSLTGLSNRSFLEEHLLLSISNAKNYQRELGLILLDIKRFQQINQLYGENVGDNCLEEIASRLKICEEFGAIAAHCLEDNFAILLPTLNDFNDAAKLCQTVINHLREPIIVHLDGNQPMVKNPPEIKLDLNMGIAIYPIDGSDAQILWRNAEIALQRSKETGSNGYQFHSASMTSRATRQLRLEELLKEALAEQGLFLAYQPIVNIQSGSITGMEALLRWHNLELQRVAPGNLIAIAEAIDLIVPLGEWVIKAACIQNHLWQQNGISSLPISVNLSSRQFKAPNLASTIARILQSTKLEPHWLELEITEQVIMENSDTIFKVLRDLLQMGVRISIDGFGSSYCSLSFLKKFPFHTLKIHQSFIQELEDNPKDTSIIASIVNLGRSFNIRVIAKGVERIQQLKLLRKLECYEMQGYLFSEPLNSEDATNVLRRGNVNYLIP
ncbi:EAL domain-containing protein [Gloeocapsa sp. PCC 73106]|uniref:EAL domain-containing protein n=1 Tax=Gloeocapsa sp. PCC 73106 TaxID=102232 RepID=UPI0002AC12C6|nr:EAL domain-containing protein [Gloeocapsa sp. PCC 73106]ELR97704.1 PAS domain S-box/diguanylate cyclase (GGDEF) domain-containing protein [Gloeocapsa sp. PCC 73106]